MTIAELRALLDDPETHRVVLDGYPGLYHLGITTTPEGEFGYYLRAPRAPDGIRVVTLREQPVTVIVDGDPAPTLPAAAQALEPGVWTRLQRRKRIIKRSLATLLVRYFTAVPERAGHRPLACGLAIHNWSDDERENRVIAQQPFSGSIGCFVTLENGDSALLSAAHILSEGNTGLNGSDKIVQEPRTDTYVGHEAATLTDFVPLLTSPADARPELGNVAYNLVDAAVATLCDGVTGRQAYLPERPPLTLTQIGTPAVDDVVRKVGATTGDTTGTVKAVGTVASVEHSGFGVVWFKDTFIVEASGGGPFVQRGDSGALVIKPSTGEALGLLYALDAGGYLGLVCPLEPARTALNWTLA
jgi:hypothetical protein